MIYHWEILENLYRTMINLKTSAETIPWKTLKNPEFNPKPWYVNKKKFNKFHLLFIF